MSLIRVALVQAAPVVFDHAATIEKTAELAAEAAAKGAQLALFPEAFISGYPNGLDWGGAGTAIRGEEGQRDYGRRYHASAVVVTSTETERLGVIARKNRLYLVVGVIEREGGTLYCAVLFFNPEGVLFGRRRKVMPTVAERLVWGQGDGSTLQVHDTPLGRMGAVICWENYMPLLRASMYAQGIELYLAPTADDIDSWFPSMQHIAVEGRCFVLSCNQFTRRGDFPKDYGSFPSDDPGFVVSRGGSCLVDPFGQFIIPPHFDGPAILTAEIDTAQIAEAKFSFDCVGHYARPDLFRLEVDRTPRAPVTFVGEEAPTVSDASGVDWQRR
jgi:nitrilase